MIEDLLKTRLYNLGEKESQLGTIVFAKNDKDEEFHVIWDIPFTTSKESIMFNMSFSAIIASILHSHISVNSEIINGEIYIQTKKDLFKFTTTKIYSFPHHYKSHINLNFNIKPENLDDFLNDVSKAFYSLLDSINILNLTS